MQGLHIMSKNYGRMFFQIFLVLLILSIPDNLKLIAFNINNNNKLHLIVGAFFALGMAIRSCHRHLKSQPEKDSAGEEAFDDPAAKQKALSTGKDKSDATAQAKAQRIRMGQSKADQQALGAAIASFPQSKRNFIQNSISYIKFLKDKVKKLEEEISEIKSFINIASKFVFWITYVNNSLFNFLTYFDFIWFYDLICRRTQLKWRT